MPSKSNHSSTAPNFVRSPRLTNEIGQLQSAPADAGQFVCWGMGKKVIFIGLGPEPKQALAALLEHLNLANSHALNITYTEAPNFSRQMPRAWQEQIPAAWQKMELPGNCAQNQPVQADILPNLTPWLGNPTDNCIVLYKPGLKLFPSYFVPLAAQIRAAQLNLSPLPQNDLKFTAPRNPKILLAGTRSGLLVAELAENFQALGCELQIIDPQDLSAQIPAILAKNRPDLFLSVNFSGLDPLGEVFYLLHQANVQTASWCVDNPWHLLSKLRAPWWQQMHIFVTDHSFISSLQAHGAQNVHHLPLATNPHLFCPSKKSANLLQNIVFAGRTEFPNKNKFFAGCKIANHLLAPALIQTQQGQKADFNFWVEQLKISPLWPGSEVRKAGFAAETCSLAWRKSCVQASLALDIKIYGNSEWQEQIPAIKAQLQPPVDYYNQLPAIYASSQIVLNITSLLLPAGLTQRNFDAWAAGSICLSDKTSGLEIFPANMLEYICYDKPEEIQEKAEAILKSCTLQQELKTAWQQLILNEHSYKQRVQAIIEAVA